MAKTASDKPVKYFDDQFDDEEVLLVFRKHPIVMRKGLIFCGLGLIAGVAPVAINPMLGFGWFFGGLAAGIVLCMLILLPYWINWYYSVFIVTNQRLIQITQRGFFHKSVVDLNLSQIQSINYEVAGLEATLLGFGTILVQSYIGDLVIRDIHRPGKVQRELSQILRDQGVEPVEYPPMQKEANET